MGDCKRHTEAFCEKHVGSLKSPKACQDDLDKNMGHPQWRDRCFYFTTMMPEDT